MRKLVDAIVFIGMLYLGYSVGCVAKEAYDRNLWSTHKNEVGDTIVIRGTPPFPSEPPPQFPTDVTSSASWFTIGTMAPVATKCAYCYIEGNNIHAWQFYVRYDFHGNKVDPPMYVQIDFCSACERKIMRDGEPLSMWKTKETSK